MKQPVRPFCKNRENLEKAPRHNWLVLSLITSVQMPTAILYRRLLTNYGDILLTTFDTSFQNLVFILTWHTSSWVDIFLYLPVRAGEWFQKTKLFWKSFWSLVIESIISYILRCILISNTSRKGIFTITNFEKGGGEELSIFSHVVGE